MLKETLIKEPLTRMVVWFKNLFVAEYELTVWLKVETTNEYGMAVISREEHLFRLSKITKKTPKHFVGKDLTGNFFEMKTNTVMDYKIVRIH